MELAKTLIRSVARAFYDTKQVLVIDALMIHSALRDDDLGHLLGMQTKELHKLCAKLKEHRLLAVHSRQEAREGMQRPIARTYYYIDFHSSIDAIKYRIYRITKEVEGMLRPAEEKKDYLCPRCKSRWTQMEVLDNPSPQGLGFNCHKCGTLLLLDVQNGGDAGGHEKQRRLMGQLDGMLKLLQQIDNVIIPNNDFDTAMSAAVPVQRDQNFNPIQQTQPIVATQNQPSTVKGLAQMAGPQLEVSVTTTSEKTAAEQAAEAERRAALAQQNALPVWYTNSTVSGEATALGNKEAVLRQERESSGLPGLKTEDNEEKKQQGEEEAVRQVYAMLAEQKALEDQQDREVEETSGEDEEDDEFEDVTGFDSTAGTPAANGVKSVITSAPDSIKKASSESGSSAPPTVSGTPLPGDGAVDLDDRPTKKIKIEDAAGPEAKEDSDEDEEVEFEDV